MQNSRLESKALQLMIRDKFGGYQKVGETSPDFCGDMEGKVQ
jgi:hypothetical protein